MSRKLLVLNALFLAVAALAAASIGRQILTPRPLPGLGRAPAVATTPPPPTDAPAPRPTAYAVVAARNLFSPTRTETTMEATPTPVLAAKPNLYGVVLRQGKPSVAYLQDPVNKRVNPYRIGDSVSGGKLSSIKRDSVTIERPDGTFDVALRDPAKPRPAAATGPGAPATPALVPSPGALPGVPPRPLLPLPTPGQTLPTLPRAQTAPPVAQEPATTENPAAQGRRLPFNFLRRLPQAPPAGQTPGPMQPLPAPSAPIQGQQD